jgi:hypothetical protein
MSELAGMEVDDRTGIVFTYFRSDFLASMEVANVNIGISV